MNTQPEVGTIEHCKRVLEEWQHEKEQKDRELAKAVELLRRVPSKGSVVEGTEFVCELNAFLARHRK